jgi:hypothetical protein
MFKQPFLLFKKLSYHSACASSHNTPACTSARPAFFNGIHIT